jgi:hypothetical protein
MTYHFNSIEGCTHVLITSEGDVGGIVTKVKTGLNPIVCSTESNRHLTVKVKVSDLKVNVSLCFNWAPCHEGVLVEWMYSSIHYFTSAPDGYEWSASRSGRFIPRERASGTRWLGGWVGPRAGGNSNNHS